MGAPKDSLSPSHLPDLQFSNPLLQEFLGCCVARVGLREGKRLVMPGAEGIVGLVGVVVGVDGCRLEVPMPELVIDVGEPDRSICVRLFGGSCIVAVGRLVGFDACQVQVSDGSVCTSVPSESMDRRLRRMAVVSS